MKQLILPAQDVTTEAKALTGEDSVDGLLAAVREYQKHLSKEDRLGFWGEIQDGYCNVCAGNRLPCYCAPCFDE